jgi:hypothetical protein
MKPVSLLDLPAGGCGRPRTEFRWRRSRWSIGGDDHEILDVIADDARLRMTTAGVGVVAVQLAAVRFFTTTLIRAGPRDSAGQSRH